VTLPLFDTHAHLISDDWDKYPPRALRPGLPTPQRTPYTVTAEALVGLMDEHGVDRACLVQRGHLYGFDNRYIIESAQRFADRLLPVVVLDTQDPATPAQLAALVKREGVRGLRMANTRPEHLDTSWMSSPAAMDVWRTCAELNIPVTLIFFYNQLAYTLPLLRVIAGMFPSLPILTSARPGVPRRSSWPGRGRPESRPPPCRRPRTSALPPRLDCSMTPRMCTSSSPR
jgi:L-fuconolactonase